MLKINNLTYKYYNNQILDNISLNFDEPKFVAIIGPNGAGKTTLLRCLSGIYKDYSGSIRMYEKEVKNTSHKMLAKQIAYLPQSNSLPQQILVNEFLSFSFYPVLKPYNALNLLSTNYDKIVERFNIRNILFKRFSDISGGESQKVMLAGLALQNCKVVLIDEPFTFLDPSNMKFFYEILKDFVSVNNCLVIAVLHDITNVVSYADQIIGLKDKTLRFNIERNDPDIIEKINELYSMDFSWVFHPHSKIQLPIL